MPVARIAVVEMMWGDKGCVYDPTKCTHPANDGCMWCCMRCNTDTHRCPGCGTVTDHQDSECDDCAVLDGIDDIEVVIINARVANGSHPASDG